MPKTVKIVRNPAKYEGNVCVVEWGDAWTSGMAYTTASDAKKLDNLITKDVGFFVNQTLKGITIAGSYGDGRYRGPTFIPNGMVRSITLL